MRKIKFRGQEIDTKKFVYGDLAQMEPYISNGIFCTIKTEPYVCKKVNPNTVCEFIGLTDKNGVEIYEGDIVKVDIFTKNYCIVFGESKKWGASFQYKSDYSIYYLTENYAKDCVVVGNIYENPELL